jgi:hypothetical protein
MMWRRSFNLRSSEMSPRADPRNSLGGVDILEIEKGVPDAIQLKPKDRYNVSDASSIKQRYSGGVSTGMPVSEAMRRVEREIDEHLEQRLFGAAPGTAF